MQQSVFHSAALSGTAVVPHDTRTCGVSICAPSTAPAASFTVSSTTTMMGHRSHTVITRNSQLAYALYEQALQIDIEPDFAHKRGVWTLGFICTDIERDNAVSLAMEVAA